MMDVLIKISKELGYNDFSLGSKLHDVHVCGYFHRMVCSMEKVVRRFLMIGVLLRVGVLLLQQLSVLSVRSVLILRSMDLVRLQRWWLVMERMKIFGMRRMESFLTLYEFSPCHPFRLGFVWG
jgi:hypothetical protein